MTGKKPPELEFPEIDDDMQYLLGYYYEMKRGNRLTFSEVQSYCTMMGVELAAWECRIIMRIDAIFER